MIPNIQPSAPLLAMEEKRPVILDAGGQFSIGAVK